MRSRGPLKYLKDSKLILNESKLFLSRISLVPFRTFFSKPVTGQELFLAVSYSRPALNSDSKLTRYSTTRSIYPLSRGKTGLGKGGPGAGLFIIGVREIGTKGTDLLGVLGRFEFSWLKDWGP